MHAIKLVEVSYRVSQLKSSLHQFPISDPRYFLTIKCFRLTCFGFGLSNCSIISLRSEYIYPYLEAFHTLLNRTSSRITISSP